MTEDNLIMELARSMVVGNGDHVVDLLESCCPRRVELAQLLLALVGWSVDDLVEAMGEDVVIATHGD